MGAEAARELADTRDRLIAALADDVRGAELPRKPDPVGITAEENDPFRAEPLRRE